jgi:hypothetical protein
VATSQGLPLVACTLALIAAISGRAQTSPTPTATTTDPANAKGRLPEIVIEARKETLRRRAYTFVTALSHSRRFPESDRPAPHWQEPLCFEVAGLPRKYTEFVAARLVQIATSVGADVFKDCSRLDVNFLVVFTPNPAETLRYLIDHPLMLQDAPGTSLPQIERFLNPRNPVAVRVWHSTEILGDDGTPCLPNVVGWLVCGGHPGGSRIVQSSGAAFARTLVVIDSTRIKDIQLEQLSAYVAMVGLADIDDDVNVGDTPSILRLFTDPAEKRPEGLTEWDHAFLSGLYHVDWRNAQQRMQIADRMVKEIEY